MKITKISSDIKDRMPDGETMALQVKVLKMQLKDNPKLDKTLADLISKLPSPRIIRQEFSEKECEVLFETIEYVWKKLTNTTLLPEKELHKAPETLMGNYILLPRGVLLSGLNTFSTIKQNATLICEVLGIGGWVFQEYLHRPPNELIRLILKHGGVRLFINKQNELFAQMTGNAYAKIGRSKVRKYDFQKKVVKLIDLKAPYNGWSSGITVLL